MRKLNNNELNRITVEHGNVHLSDVLKELLV